MNTASARLRRLRDLGLLAMKGGGSRTRCVLGPSFAADPPQPAEIPSSPTADTHQVLTDAP